MPLNLGSHSHPDLGILLRILQHMAFFTISIFEQSGISGKTDRIFVKILPEMWTYLSTKKSIKFWKLSG